MNYRRTDLVTISGVRYRIIDRIPVSYAMPESPAERKARVDADAPTISYTVATIERVRDE